MSLRDNQISLEQIAKSRAISRELMHGALNEAEVKDNSELQVLFNLLDEEQQNTKELIDQIWGYLRPIIVETPAKACDPNVRQPSESCLTPLNNLLHERVLVQKSIVRTLADLRSFFKLTMIKPPRTTDKMIKSLGIEKWRAENEEVCEEFGITAKIVYRQISLETAEALVQDSLELRRIYEEMGGK